MLFWTVGELMHMARNELCDLADMIGGLLPDLEPGTIGRCEALLTLANIRRAGDAPALALNNVALSRVRSSPVSLSS
jgi:hypothetical protein